MKILALLLGLSISAFAQNNFNGQWKWTTVAPTTACTRSQVWVVMPTGVLYTCQNGLPAVVSTSSWSGTLVLANTALTTRGDLMTVNSTPALARLAKGTQYQTLQGGATDLAWGAVNLAQSTAVTGVLPNANTTAVATNTASAIVARDASGNFAAGTITASLTGTASGNAVVLSGSTPSIGGGALLVGACASDVATVTGATTGMVAVTSPVTYPGDGATYEAYVSAADTVTVKVCAIIALTPTASLYRVRVIQ